MTNTIEQTALLYLNSIQKKMQCSTFVTRETAKHFCDTGNSAALL